MKQNATVEAFAGFAATIYDVTRQKLTYSAKAEEGYQPMTEETTKPKKKAVAKKKPTVKKTGRPLQYPDKTMVRMAKGMLKRVNGALKADEAQADFMRTAVDRELRARRK